MKVEEHLMRDNATARVLEWFSRNPSGSIHVNELARRIGLSNASCSRILNNLERKGILSREEIGNAHLYSMKDHYLCREMKRFFILLRLHESGLVEAIARENPSLTNLVLYGSCATGRYDESSDLDLLAIANEDVAVDLERYDEVLNVRIQIARINIGRWLKMKSTNDGFYTEVKRDGIVLHGGDLP
jgi:predicted nucleotidyltransferase